MLCIFNNPSETLYRVFARDDNIYHVLPLAFVAYVIYFYVFYFESIKSDKADSQIAVKIRSWHGLVYHAAGIAIINFVVSLLSGYFIQLYKETQDSCDFIVGMLSGGVGGAFWGLYLFLKYSLVSIFVLPALEAWLARSHDITQSRNYLKDNKYAISFTFGLIGGYCATPLGTISWVFRENLFGAGLEELFSLNMYGLLRFLMPPIFIGVYIGCFVSYSSHVVDKVVPEFSYKYLNFISSFVIFFCTALLAVMFYHESNSNSFWIDVLSKSSKILSLWMAYYFILFSFMYIGAILFRRFLLQKFCTN